jgi:hypothetical protein
VFRKENVLLVVKVIAIYAQLPPCAKIALQVSSTMPALVQDVKTATASLAAALGQTPVLNANQDITKNPELVPNAAENIAMNALQLLALFVPIQECLSTGKTANSA